MITIRWTQPTVADLQDIQEYLEPDYPNTANRLVTRLLEAPERLVQFPEMGKRVAEADQSSIRELIVARACRLIYLWNEPVISILAIVHARKSLIEMEPKPWEIY